MKHTEKYKVNCHDTDCNGILSPTGYLRYLQDAAHCQFECEGPTYDELLERGLAFLLSRIKAVFIKPVYPHEEITASSWALEESSGFSFRRSYEMTKNGETAAVAKSVWALYDINTKRLCRVSADNMLYGTDRDVDLELPRRIAAASDVVKVGERTVIYEDIDKNLHMNNTRYADLLCSYIPDIIKKRVTSVDISYVSEARLGDTVEIYLGEIGGAYYLKTVRGDGRVNAEALIETESL